MAFGTGTHETTNMCMQLLEKHLKSDMRVMDVGTGSGILAIAAARLGAKEVLAIDIDPAAVKVARENIVLNHVEDRVRAVEGDLCKSEAMPCDLAVANIVADAIRMLAAPLTRHLQRRPADLLRHHPRAGAGCAGRRAGGGLCGGGPPGEGRVGRSGTEKRGGMMHRFYVEHPASAGKTAVLSPEESAHAARVLRLRPDEEIVLLDGQTLWSAKLEVVNDRACEARVLSALPSPEPCAKVTLIQGLPKSDKLEWIVQKATELGVWALWPVEMTRCVARGGKDSRRDRLSRIALEAAKQSGRAHVPQIEPAQAFRQALEALKKDPPDLLLTAWEEERALPMSRAIADFAAHHGRPGRVAVVIGPEGGIAAEEWEALRALGAVSVTLGPRILRTETAGLCALSVLWAALGEM